MTEHPSAEAAAAALRDVDRRKDQAVDARRTARWVYVVFGVLIFCCTASNDFAPEWAANWGNPLLAAGMLGYAVLGRTRRGAALFGQPARVDRSAVPRKFPFIMLGIIAVLAIVVFVVARSLSVPYFSTGLGAVLAIALIGFGPQLQNGINNLVKRVR